MRTDAMYEIALRLNIAFSPEALQRDLAEVPDELWSPVLEANTGYSWLGVALRSRDGKPSTLNVGQSYVETPLLGRLLNLQHALACFKCDLNRVRLLSLMPGASIGTHTDSTPSESRSEVRLHVPIVTNPLASIIISGRALEMKEGDLWFLDVSLPHSVRNAGQTARIHLVIDCIVNRWLARLLDRPLERVTQDEPRTKAACTL